MAVAKNPAKQKYDTIDRSMTQPNRRAESAGVAGQTPAYVLSPDI